MTTPPPLHSSRRAAILTQVVERLSTAARITPPDLVLRDGRNACYHPIRHAISLSTRLAEQLKREDLDALLAHEVGHARRRQTILLNTIRCSAPPIALCLAGGIVATVVHARTGSALWSTATLFATMTATAWLAQRLSNRWQMDYLAEEIEADRFAVVTTGRPDAMVRVLRECARIEDGGSLGAEACQRIEASRRQV